MKPGPEKMRFLGPLEKRLLRIRLSPDLEWLVPDRGVDCPVGPEVAAIHAGCVEGQSPRAPAGDRDHAAAAVRGPSATGIRRQRVSVGKYSGSATARACARQRASAPSPISSTCLERSITARAANTGLRGPRMPATAPARRPFPSITEASI